VGFELRTVSPDSSFLHIPTSCGISRNDISVTHMMDNADARFAIRASDGQDKAEETTVEQGVMCCFV